MEFIATTRGGRKLLYEGFCYVKLKDLSDGKESWECELRRRTNCKAKLHLRGNRFLDQINEHTHAADAARTEMLATRANMTQRAKDTEETPQQIITEGVRNMSEAASGRMVAVENVRRNIRRNRQHAGNRLPVPQNAAAIVIPPAYQVTTRGGLFLRYDNGEGNAERILIFMSDDGQQSLLASQFWFADGTFKTVPDQFFQLYTLHSLSANGRVFPCVFVLLTNKRQDTYEHVLREVSALARNGLHPEEALIDFERAALNALANVFPGIEVKGCFFHLTQNVYRQIQAHGLANAYQADAEFALQLRMIPALAFVPPDDVIQSFEELQVYLPANAAPILQYFEATYIGEERNNRNGRRNPLFAIEMWNMHERTLQNLPRTNNNVEGWHRRLQADIGVYHFNFWKFLDVIKREVSLTHVEMVQDQAGQNPRQQRAVYRDVQQRIRNIVEDYPNRDIIAFLRGIAHNFNY